MWRRQAVKPPATATGRVLDAIERTLDSHGRNLDALERIIHDQAKMIRALARHVEALEVEVMQKNRDRVGA